MGSLAMVQQLLCARLLRCFGVADPAAAAGTVAALAAFALILPSSTPPKAPTVSARCAAEGLPLVTTPDPIVLGAIEPADGAVSVHHTGSLPMTLQRVETSCPCVHVAPLPIELGAREAKVLYVGFIPAPDDADFVGRLLVNVTSYTADSTVALRARVQIDPGKVGQFVPD